MKGVDKSESDIEGIDQSESDIERIVQSERDIEGIDQSESDICLSQALDSARLLVVLEGTYLKILFDLICTSILHDVFLQIV